MNEWSPAGVAYVISALFAGVCSAIAAWGAIKGKNITENTAKKADLAAEKSEIAAQKAQRVSDKADDNGEKLDQIHTLTDGSLTRTQQELISEKKRSSYLEAVIIEMSAKCNPGLLEEAKKAVEQKQAIIGRRRKSDHVNEFIP